MENTDERKKPARGFLVHRNLPRESFGEQGGSLGMNAAARHVDGFDLVRRCRLDGLVVGLADHKIIPHNLTKRTERQSHRGRACGFTIQPLDQQIQPIIDQGQVEVIGWCNPVRRFQQDEMVGFEQVRDGDGSLAPRSLGFVAGRSVRPGSAWRFVDDFAGDFMIS